MSNRAEAIDILTRMSTNHFYGHREQEALKLGAEALKQVNRMDDTISRQAAIDEIKEIYEWHDNVTKERIIEHFKQLPSAERRGRWDDVEHAPNDLLYATCSVCGKRQTIETTNYCGNCGADMREAKNECDDCFAPMFYNLEDDDSICMDCGVGE